MVVTKCSRLLRLGSRPSVKLLNAVIGIASPSLVSGCVSGESVEAIQASPGRHRAVRARTKYVRRFGDARIRASAHEASDGLLRSSGRRSRGWTRGRRPTEGRVRISGFESDAGG